MKALAVKATVTNIEQVVTKKKTPLWGLLSTSDIQLVRRHILWQGLISGIIPTILRIIPPLDLIR